MYRKTPAFVFACPYCRTPLEWVDVDCQRCPDDNRTFSRDAGIWRFLRADRMPALAQFMDEYETIRRSENRGADNAAYYDALPFEDLTGTHSDDWAIRANSYLTLLSRVIEPLERGYSRPLRILDCGAGNGWLSNRLARRGHLLGAVDLVVNNFDGLGAHTYYDRTFVPIQAEFDYLPFGPRQADLIVFNAALHYSADYVATLRETLRVLRRPGVVVVVDTPVYHNGDSGAQMVQEREEDFESRFGFPSNALGSENYLTYRRLRRIVGELELTWDLYRSVPMWRTMIRRWRCRLRGEREPAHFPIIVLQRE